jgi:hypothetical protein
MGRWTWAICEACWYARHPTWMPVRLKERAQEPENCGWCGRPSDSGIYVRADAKDVPFGSGRP